MSTHPTAPSGDLHRVDAHPDAPAEDGLSPSRNRSQRRHLLDLAAYFDTLGRHDDAERTIAKLAPEPGTDGPSVNVR